MTRCDCLGMAEGPLVNLRYVYFGGTRQQWKDMNVSETGLESCTIYYLGEEYPITDYLDNQGLKYSSNGDGTCFVYGCEEMTDNIVVLDSSPQGDRVTCISTRAFAYCHWLTNITLPDSVTSIGDYAFTCCRSLTNITFNATKAEWQAIEKAENWDAETGNYTVHCTDGDIPKSES